MWLFLIALILAFLMEASAAAETIASIAKSPYRLAEYVETHESFDWQPLWNALGIGSTKIYLHECEASNGVPLCSTELISVVEPAELILLLENEAGDQQVYLRYRSSRRGTSAFAGAFAPPVKYFRPEHRLIRFGRKPFLIVTGQGNAGTGLSSKVEFWLDLTSSRFSPVFSFTSEGDRSALGVGFGRVVRMPNFSHSIWKD